MIAKILITAVVSVIVGFVVGYRVGKSRHQSYPYPIFGNRK